MIRQPSEVEFRELRCQLHNYLVSLSSRRPLASVIGDGAERFAMRFMFLKASLRVARHLVAGKNKRGSADRKRTLTNRCAGLCFR